MDKSYDIVILGGGPAGLSAAIYAGRARLRTLLIEKGNYGGRAATTRTIVNYPGISRIDGMKLGENMAKQARDFGVEFVSEQIRSVELDGERKILRSRRNVYEAKALILALGSRQKVLGIKGERELTGKGVCYCATCDAPFFEGQVVYVLGAGDQAIEESMYIAQFAKKVVIVSRRKPGDFRCNKASVEEVMKVANISFLFDSTISGILGEEEVEGVSIRNLVNGDESRHSCQGVFIFAGIVPDSDLVKDFGITDEEGWILTNENMETGIKGVYGAGDVRKKYLRQVVTAVSDGAISASAAGEYIRKNP